MSVVTADPFLHVRVTDFLSEDECRHIAHILTRDESKILNLSNPQNEETGYTGLTAQYLVYNLLRHPDIRPLNIPDRIFELPQFKDSNELGIQAWGNILYQGQGLPTHHHGTVGYFPTDLIEEYKDQLTTEEYEYEIDRVDPSRDELQNFYALNLFIQGEQPSYTHYRNEPIPNIHGELHIVGHQVEHGVKNNIYRTPRISMAMDVYLNADHHKEDVQYNQGESSTRRFLYFKRKQSDV
jgi:hypothetical protein